MYYYFAYAFTLSICYAIILISQLFRNNEDDSDNVNYLGNNYLNLIGKKISNDKNLYFMPF
jgi:hypothetical protein